MKFFAVRVWCVLVLVMGSGLCVPAFRVQGQTPAPTTPAKASPAGDFSKEAVVVEKVSTRVREEADGTGSHETSMRVRIQSEAGVKQMAVLLFTYTASNQQAEIGYVRVIKPDGTVVVTPDYNVQDLPADVSREAPMYSDIHQKHVAVKGLGVGDTLEYKVTMRTVKPEVQGQFWLEYSFEKNLIVLDEQVDLDLPEGKAATVATPDVQPTIAHAQGRVLYHWASSNLTRPDPDKPKSTKHWKPSVQVTTFTGWDQVGAWYWSLQKDGMTVTPAIQAKAAALTKGLTTDDEKMRAIFSAVALHTHYIGISFGIGRYQPHAADDVLSNEYGDCKDKHTLLATLLRAAGIEAWPVLISSSRELDPAVPSPAQFDHVITVVPRDGKLIWMDATEEVAPIGVLMQPLRDKQVLAIPASNAAYLDRTPAILPFPQSFLFTASGKLSDKGEFAGHIEETFRGDSELVMRALFRQVPQSQWKQFVQQMIGNMGFGGETGQPEVSPVEQTTEPFHFSFDYTRQKYSEWEDRRINPPMPGVGWELAPGTREVKPADDIELGSVGEQVYKTSVQMAPGWVVSAPTGIDLKEDWAEYHSSYSFANGTFTAERKLVMKKDKVPLADWDKYRAFREGIYGDTVKMAGVSEPFPLTGRPVITAKVGGTINGVPGPTCTLQLSGELQPVRDAMTILAATPPAAAADRTRARDSCRTQAQAFEVESQNLDATKLISLYFAQALDPVWTCLGWSALEANEQAEAEMYLRPAWQLSQNPLAGYQLARLLETKGNKVGAAHMYELAYITSQSGLSIYVPGMDIHKMIKESYQKLTGKEMTATALNHDRYDGSLLKELESTNLIPKLIGVTTLTGQALYSVMYEIGRPTKATFLNGDKGMNALASALEGARFPSSLPKNSKVRLIREVRVICSPYAGCDAELLLPGKLQMPPIPMKTLPGGAKQVQIEMAPPPKQ